ncbi:MAG: VanW family protein [Candidatus Jacksonbacteria bacterium]
MGSFNLGGLTEGEVKDIVSKFRDNLEARGIVFVYKNKEVQIFPRVFAPDDPDLTYELFYIDAGATAQKAIKIGRDQEIFQNLKTKINLLKTAAQTKLDYHIFEENISQALRENFQDQEILARDAQLKIDEDLAVVIIPEEYGVVPDYKLGIRKLKNNLDVISSEVIILPALRDEPGIIASALTIKKQEIELLFANRENLILRFQDRTWSIDKNYYKNWLDVQSEHLVFQKGFIDYIKEYAAEAIETSVQEARFILTPEGRVQEFQPSRQGRQINYDKTLALINQTFFSDVFLINEHIDILTEVIEPKYTTESVNNLGVKELIGVGQSNFAGSPQNRRHNIKVGAAALNGILIPSGEEFSLADALGEINEASGYLPELVIKGNRTIPEFGGGLCQIGTTLFRGALQSGLEITERRNHSYRVSYYEPAGTDCTIYPPHPDCRFRNDTGRYILLQTYIKQDDLIFEFWGTSDDRKIVVGEPEIYNITKPLPTKYIETEDLPPGETKCTERAHNGAETKFDYYVKYPDGTEKMRTFYSYYKPWQAVCLMGVEKADKDIEADKNETN